MWEQVVKWRSGGSTYSQIHGRLSQPENMKRFDLEEVPSEETLRRRCTHRMAASEVGEDAGRGPSALADTIGPHELDLKVEIQRLKTQVTKVERKSLRPSRGIEGKIHEALRQLTSDGELPIFLGDYDTALGVYVVARLGVARDLHSQYENLRKEPKLRVDLTKWDVDLLDTLERRTRYARSGIPIPAEHQQYEQSPEWNPQEKFLPFWGGMQMTKLAVTTVDYRPVHQAHLEFREFAEPFIPRLEEPSLELNRLSNSLIDVLDELSLMHFILGSCPYCRRVSN